MAESAEGMTEFQYAGDDPINGNDPIGNLGKTPPLTTPSPYNVSPFHGSWTDEFDDAQAMGNLWADIAQAWNISHLPDWSSGGGGAADGAGDPTPQGGAPNVASEFITPSGQTYYINDGSNAVYNISLDGSVHFLTFLDQGGADVQPSDAVLSMDKFDLYVGFYAILPELPEVTINSTRTAAAANSEYDPFMPGSTALKNADDPTTIGVNDYHTNYTGGNNPMTNDGHYSYDLPPTNRADWGSMNHDLGYDSRNAIGLGSVLTNTDVLDIDYTFIGYELSLSINPYNGATFTERWQGLFNGLGIFGATLLKTIVYGLNAIKN